MPTVERAQVLAYRAVANQLHERVDADPADLAVLDLGVANVPAGSARQALAARTTKPHGTLAARTTKPHGTHAARTAEPHGTLAARTTKPHGTHAAQTTEPHGTHPAQTTKPHGTLALAWSTRGAPHLHRPADLPGLATALWPVSDADAAARVNSNQIPEAGRLGLAAFRSTAEAFHDVVRAETAKGDASRGVSDRVPAELVYDCRACGARHISGLVFQQAALPGGVQLDETAAKTVLMPIPDWPGIPDKGEPGGLIRAYLRLLGPATQGDVARYLGTNVSALKEAWPEGLIEVSVDGRRAWLAEEDVDALLAAKPVHGVRLLPPADPFLQARDRGVLTPDKSKEKQVWRPLGNPGVLLVDGDLAGTWRARVAGKRLALTVSPWQELRPAQRRAVEQEAQTVAAARELTSAQVAYEGAVDT